MFVVGLLSPTAQPSVADNMYKEFKLGFAGGLMYTVGLMSFQTVAALAAGMAETDNNSKEDRIIAIENFVLLILANIHLA